MKTKLLVIVAAISMSITSDIYSQISVGLRLGTSPSVDPGTHHLIVNRQEAFGASLVNAERVKYSEQLGLLVRLDKDRFWFMSELTYCQSKTEYSLQSLNDVQEGATRMSLNETRKFLELPVVAGVSLGVFEMFSGLSLTYDLSRQNAFASIDGFSTSGRQMHPGWLAGVGVNLGKVLFDMRYQQQFVNYGQGYFANGQELLLKNAPGRLVITGGFRI